MDHLDFQTNLDSNVVHDIVIGSNGYEGKISGLNMWNNSLSTKEIVDWTDCNGGMSGNFFNWLQANITLFNMTAETTSGCPKSSINYHVSLVEYEHDEGVLFCKQRGGDLVDIDELRRVLTTGCIFRLFNKKIFQEIYT